MIDLLSAPILWILLSILLSVFLNGIRLRISSGLYQYLKLGRWAIVPYLALVSGHVSPRLMGITDLDWALGLGIGVGIVLGLLLLVVIANVTAGAEVNRAFYRSIPENPRPSDVALPSKWIWVAIQACTEEVHWLFLRAALWETLLFFPQLADTSASYVAVWVAGTIALIETSLHSTLGTEWVWSLTTLLLSSVLYLYTRNIYLCCMLHVGLAIVRPSFTSATHSAHA